MSEVKHTPGPWVRSGESDIRGGDNFLVGMVNPIGSFREISKANARLIASAPDMLADHKENARILGFLVTELQGRIEAGKLGAVMACLDRCNASVAKAEGLS